MTTAAQRHATPSSLARLDTGPHHRPRQPTPTHLQAVPRTGELPTLPVAVVDVIPGPPVADCAQRWLRHCKLERNMSSNTILAYSRDIGRLVLWLTEQECLTVDLMLRPLLVEYVHELRGSGLQARSVARHLSTLRTFGHWLVDRRHLNDNPAALLEQQKLERDLPDVLTREEVEQLLRAPGQEGDRAVRDTAMLEVLYATGLRVSELVGLTLQDIDLERGVVRCMGKGRKERLVPMGEVARARLLLYLEHVRPQLAKFFFHCLVDAGRVKTQKLPTRQHYVD